MGVFVSVCVFVCIARKTSRKMRFLCGRRGASGASKNYHDRSRLPISFKTSLSSIRKKKMQAKKYVFFKLYSKVSVWIVNGTLGCLSFC